MMDEPDRMLDQTSSAFERALLQEGRCHPGTEQLRAHTLAALGLAGSAGLATGGVLAWLMAKAWTTKLLLAMSALAVLVAIPVSYVIIGRNAEPARAASASQAMVPQPSPAATVSQPPVVPPPASTAAAVSPTTIQPSPARASAGASFPLRAELAALDAVRSTLANDDSAGALSFLEAYFRTFPRGRLHLEAEVLRIDALAKGGRRDAAKKYAEDFLRRHPNSVLTARVQPYAER
jgi:hypothetical protein